MYIFLLKISERLNKQLLRNIYATRLSGKSGTLCKDDFLTETDVKWQSECLFLADVKPQNEPAYGERNTHTGDALVFEYTNKGVMSIVR